MRSARIPVSLLLKTLFAAAFLSISGAPSQAETDHVRVGTQFGLNYLPLFVMEHERLWERHANASGVPLRVEYARMGGGATLNDALLSDTVQVVAGGTVPMLLMWDLYGGRPEGGRAIGAEPGHQRHAVQPPGGCFLNRPEGRRSHCDAGGEIVDAGGHPDGCRGAYIRSGPSAPVAILTVSMQHPDALTTLLARSSQVTAYISSSPFQEMALRQPGIVKLTDNIEVFGGPSTLAVTYTKQRFVTDNPVVVGAYYAALEEAIQLNRNAAGRRDRGVHVWRREQGPRSGGRDARPAPRLCIWRNPGAHADDRRNDAPVRAAAQPAGVVEGIFRCTAAQSRGKLGEGHSIFLGVGGQVGSYATRGVAAPMSLIIFPTSPRSPPCRDRAAGTER